MKKVPHSKVARWPQRFRKLAIVYSCCLVLIAMLSFGISYAYFSAKVDVGGDIVMGNIMVEYKDSSEATASNLETLVYRDYFGELVDETESETIMPGDQIHILGSVQNVGTANAYIILQAELILMSEDATPQEEQLLDSKFYDLSGNSVVYNSSTKIYTTPASSLAVDQITSLAVDETESNIVYLVDKSITSVYEGRTFKLKLTINALQADNLVADTKYSSLAIQATNLMLNSTTRIAEYIKIEGSSSQEGTPSITSPQTISSLGTTTANGQQINVTASGKNLFDISKIVSNSNVVNNGDGTLTVKAYAVDLGKKLKTLAPNIQVGKSYTLSMNTTGGQFIYLSASSYLWHVNTSREITQTDLDSYICCYTDPNAKTEPATISKMQIVEAPNLFDISKVVSSLNVVNNGDGTLSVTAFSTSSGAPANGDATLKNYAPSLKVGKTYSLNATSTGSKKNIYLLTSKRAWAFGTNLTITQDDLDSKVIWYANGDLDTTFTAIISNITILDLNPDIEYTPYQQPITSSIYLEESLRSVGSEKDYLELNNGVAKIVRNISYKLLTGVEAWSLVSIGGTNTIFGLTLVDAKTNSAVLSSHFVEGTDISIVGNQLQIKIPTATVGSVENFKTWLASNNVEVQYVLASATETTIDKPIVYTVADQTSFKVVGATDYLIY